MDQHSEEWRPVVGYEGAYEVSDHGRVRACEKIDEAGHHRRARSLTPVPASRLHLVIVLWRDGNRKTYLVHRLVLGAFVGPCPDGMEGCHNDGDPTNNHTTNLRWDTRSENMRDAVRHGTNCMAAKTHCKHGHEFSPDNTILRLTGGRKCRTCQREIDRRRRARL